MDYHDAHPLDGYRRLTFRRLDEDLVACRPKTVWRVLKDAGRLDRHAHKPSKKGTGFVQPQGPHLHWHIDVSYLDVGGSFFYLCSILDGYSRFIVHWDLRPHRTELDIECILQAAREKFPTARPRIISDNGPQSIAHQSRPARKPQRSVQRQTQNLLEQIIELFGGFFGR